MRVLVGCEYSGRVRDAFLALGHDAVSCDVIPSRAGGPHLLGDVRDYLSEGWDLAVLHPPCTFLAKVSAPRLYQDPSRLAELRTAAAFFRDCLNAPVPRVAVENPVMLGVAVALVGKRADQWVQPWQFGDPFTKNTGLWLRGLPPLRPTRVVEPTASWVQVTRAERSTTFPGLAAAMASQWSVSEGGPVPLW